MVKKNMPGRNIEDNISNPTYGVGETIANDKESWLISDETASVSYYGYAGVGSDTSKAVWKIRRESVNGNVTTVTYADGDLNYDNVWDDRASLDYS